LVVKLAFFYVIGGVIVPYFELYTDGGCWPNPGPLGAWAFILKSMTVGELKRAGVVSDTTNNRMELTAVVEGLNELPDGSTVKLFSDSQYVVNGINLWRHKWKMKSWANVKNTDLWKEIDALATVNCVEAVWVRGHDGHAENEECDRMAYEAYRNNGGIMPREYYAKSVQPVL
jgi:ribonuclease HI